MSDTGRRAQATASTNIMETDAPIPTWFNVGGRADLLARPRTVDELLRLLESHAEVRVLGDGANLLVDDGGVGGLVVSLEHINDVLELEEGGLHCVEAGANLPRLVVETVRRGRGGLEGLAGVPASLGGAVFMNAGGAFGQIADTVERVHFIDPDRRPASLYRSEIDFAYRHSGLDGCVVVAAELRLTPGDPAVLRSRLKEVMASKSRSQPMASDSAGCVFKNPLVDGERVSAGRLIDRAGCKGLRSPSGRAEVSVVHANFFVTHDGARAADVLQLIDAVRERVRSFASVELETEIAIWRRGGAS